MERLDRNQAQSGPEANGLGPVPVFWVGSVAPPRRLEELLAGRSLTLVPVTGETELVSRAAAQERAVLCFGPGFSPAQVRSALEAVAQEAPQASCLHLALLDPATDLGELQDLIDEDRLFYLAHSPLPERDLAALLASAASALDPRIPRPASRTPAPAFPLDRYLDLETLRRLALANSAEEIGDAMRAAIVRAAAARSGRCLLYDPERRTLWAPAGGAASGTGESPAVGLISFILRTGLSLSIPRIAEDPRFDRDLDNPEGSPSDRFLGVPVRTGGGQVAAVLVALRSPDEPAFEPLEIAALETVAAHSAPYLAPWVPDAQSSSRSGPFREQALRELELPSTGLEPLRLTPRWTRWTYWLILSALAAALLCCVLVRVPEYASGVAVVRTGGRIDVTANASGTVSSLAVQPHSRVRKGDLLLTLYNAEEAANLDRLDRELGLKLVQRLQSPADPGVAQDLLALRAERDLARARLAERELRAPADGEVSDVRAEVGQLLPAGQPVLSIIARAELPSVVALLPGRYLPQLRRGMALRLELPGYPYVYRWLKLDAVSADVIGPAEARRLIGPVAGDAVDVQGPLAVVTARLPSSTFEVNGQTLSYRDGMPTQAEVRVRSERLAFILLPALKGVWGTPHD